MAIRPDLVTPEEDEELLRWYERNYPGLVRRVPDEPIGDQPPMPPEGELPSEPAPSDTPFLQDALGGILGLLSGDTSGMGALMSRIGLDDVSMPSFLQRSVAEEAPQPMLPPERPIVPRSDQPFMEKFMEGMGMAGEFFPAGPGGIAASEYGYETGVVGGTQQLGGMVGPEISEAVSRGLRYDPFRDPFMQDPSKATYWSPREKELDWTNVPQTIETFRARPLEEQIVAGLAGDLVGGGAFKALQKAPGAIDFLSAQGPALKSAAQQGLLAPIMPGIQAGTPGGVPRRVVPRPELASELEDLRAMVDDRYMDNIPRLLKTPEGGFSLVRARNALRSYLDQVNPDEFTSLDKFSELDYRLETFDDIQRGNYERGADGAQRFQDERESAWEEILDALDELEIKAADDIVDAPPVTPDTRIEALSAKPLNQLTPQERVEVLSANPELRGRFAQELPSEEFLALARSQADAAEAGVKELGTVPRAASDFQIDDAVTGRPITLRTFRGSGRERAGDIYGAIDQPILGEARYSASSRGEAKRFGPNIEEVDVTLQNPLVLRSDDDWRQILEEAGFEPEFMGWRLIDYTPYEAARESGDLVKAEQEMERLLGKLTQFRRFLDEKGYDGVIVDIPEGGRLSAPLRADFGSSQVIEFKPPATPEVVVPDEPSPAALTPEQQAGLDVTGFDDVVEQAGIPAEATVETAATVSRKNLHPRTSNLLREHYGQEDYDARLALGEFHDEAGNPIRIAAARAKIADEAVPETVPEVSPETVPETVPEPVVQPSVAAAADMPANVPDSMADLFSEVGGVEKFKQSGFEGMRRQARGRDESPKIWILTFKSADEPNRIVLRALDNTPENTRAIREMVKAGQARNIGPNMRVRSRGQTDPDRLEYVDESGQIVHEADTVIGDDIEIAIEQAMKMARETQGMPDVAVPYHVVRRGFGFDEFAEGPIAGSIPEPTPAVTTPEVTPAVTTPEVIPPDHPAVVAASEEGISIRQIDDATGEATDLTPGEPLDLTSTETPNTGSKLIDDYIERVQGNDPDARQADMTLEESLIDDMENYPYVPDDGGDGIPPGTGAVTSPDPPNNPPPVSSRTRRVMSWLSDIINAPRATLSSSEQSSLLRQGGVLFKAHPIIGAKVTANTFKTFFSEAKFAERDAFYRAQPNFDRYVNQSKLYWADTGDFTKREEEFISRLLMKVPVLKIILRASERHFTMFLNALRYEVADHLVKSWEEAAAGQGWLRSGVRKGTGGMVELPPARAMNDDELDAITMFVNHATGRGELRNEHLNAMLGYLNVPFFSPRFWLSRYQMMWDLIAAPGAATSVKVRSLIARDLAASTITNFTIMSLLAAGGAKVGMNYLGADFGKVRFPNGQEIDLWEGRQQLFKFVIQYITEQNVTRTGKVVNLNEGDSTVLGRYIQSKLNPGIPSILADFNDSVSEGISNWIDTGEWKPGVPRDFMGEEIKMTAPGITGYVASKFIPLMVQEMWEAFAEEGLVATPDTTLNFTSKKGRQNWGKIIKGKEGSGLKQAFGIDFSRMDEFSWSEFQKVWPELDIDPESEPPMLLRPTGSGAIGMSPFGWTGVGTNTYRTIDELVREMASGAGIEDKIWPFERTQIVEDIRNQSDRELTGYAKLTIDVNNRVQDKYEKLLEPLSPEFGGGMREDWHIRDQYFAINAKAAEEKQLVSAKFFGRTETPITEGAMTALRESDDPKDGIFHRYLTKLRIHLRDGFDPNEPINFLGKDWYVGVTGTPSDKYDKALSDYYEMYRVAGEALAIGTDGFNKQMDKAEARWRREGTLEYVQANTHTRPVPDALFEKLPEATQDKINASKAARAKRSRQAGKYVPKVKTPQITGEKSKNPSITPKPKSEKSIPPTPTPLEQTPRPTLEPWWEKYENRSVP